MEEAKFRKYDLLIRGILTPVTAVIGVLVGIWQYSDSQSKNVRTQYEFRKLERLEKEVNSTKKMLNRVNGFIFEVTESDSISISADRILNSDEFIEIYSFSTTDTTLSKNLLLLRIELSEADKEFINGYRANNRILIRLFDVQNALSSNINRKEEEIKALETRYLN